MSDGGGGESSKEIELGLKKRRRKNDEFPQAIARIAVAQVCECVGFQGFQQSALDKLSDVACKYILEIGKTSNFYADLAGRTECNVFDIVQGLEDLSLSQGFVGASDRDHCLSGSGIIKELSQYVTLSEEIGFAYSLPSFPIIKERKSTPSFLQAGETPPTDDIPPWLPKFPDPETYTSIPPAVTEDTQVISERIEQEQKVLEPPSLKVEQQSAHNESVFPMVVEQEDIAGRERVDNPFLAVPLQPGEKKISLVSLPAKLKEEDMVRNHSNHGELDTFVPTNQAIQNSGCDTDHKGSGMAVMENRPTVQMRFHMGKKSLDTATRYNDKGKEKVASWFLIDEEKVEKESSSEKLLREPMDIEDHTGNDIEEYTGNDKAASWFPNNEAKVEKEPITEKLPRGSMDIKEDTGNDIEEHKGNEKITSWFPNDEAKVEQESRTEKLPRELMDIEENTENDIEEHTGNDIEEHTGNVKVASWFPNDEAKVEKESRTEKLPRELMDIEENTENDIEEHTGNEKVASWFPNDEAKVENESRTEKLPREPMDIEENTENDSVVN